MSQKSRPKTSATWRSLMALSSMAFLYVGPAVSAPTHASGSALLAATESNTATNSVHLNAGAEIHSVLVHPLFEKTYACVEHGADSVQWYLGDALGADCFIVDMIDLNGRSWYRAYKEDGEQNEDWYGWHQKVLSPCKCKVLEVSVNLETNRPGVMGAKPASLFKFASSGPVQSAIHSVSRKRKLLPGFSAK